MGSFRTAVAVLGLVCASGPARAVCNFTPNKVQYLNGTTLTYRLTITNNTGSGFRGLYVVDTVSPALTNQTSNAPPEFGTATIFNTPSGTMYTWSYDLGGSGPSILGAGETFTFTITGTLPDACALFGIANTAYFHVAGSGCSGSSSEGLNTVRTEANLAVTTRLIPPTPAAGGPVAYAITVENTGTVTLTGLTVNDTVPAAVTVTGVEMPPGFNAQGPAATGGGEWRGWRDNGTLNFSPGATLTFTITGIVATTCVATEVSDTAYAEGLTVGCGGSATRMLSNVPAFVIPTPGVGLGVTQAVTGGTAIGGPVTYAIVIDNVGAATATTLTVVDTIGAEVTGIAGAAPGGIGAPVVTPIAGGTRVSWDATGLTFLPGTTWTFTVTGRMAAVCAPVSVAASAFVAATAACAASATLAVPVATAVLPSATAMSLMALQTPAAPGPGQAVTWRLVLANAGTATLTGIVITDTLPLIVTGFATGAPPGWPAAVASAAGAGASVFTWSGGPGLPPGAAFTFTLTGVAGDPCVPTTVSATALATAGWECPGLAVASSNEAGFALPASSAGLAITLLQTGTGAAGLPISYRIVVLNTGTATIHDLAITDTVSPLLIGQTRDQPVEMGAAVVAGAGPSGTRYAWSATGMPTGLRPGRAFTFTITGLAGETCVPVPVSNTAYLEAAGACAFISKFSNPAGLTISQPVAGLAVTHTLTPAAPASGDPVTYRIVIANSGAATITSLTLTETLSPVIVGAAEVRPAGWTPATIAPSAGGTLFTWTNGALTFQPGMTLTFTITGSVGPCFTGSVPARPYVTATGGCAIAALAGAVASFPLGGALAAAVAVPAYVSVGQVFDVVLTATATGNDAVENVVPAVAAGPGAALVQLLAGPTPASVALLAPGAMTAFTWTFSATGGGAVRYTATAAGATCGGALIAGAASATTFVRTPAALSATIVAGPSPLSVGQTFLLVLTVSNSGGTDASGVLPAGPAGSGAGAAAVLDGPNPPGPVTLAAGQRLAFTWTMSAAASGTVFLTCTATGFDATSGQAVSTGPRTATRVLVQAPAQLVATAIIAPAQVSVGQWYTTTLWITNTGEAAAVGVTTAVANGGGAAAVPVAGPVPLFPFTLSGGATVAIGWTWSPAAAGGIVLGLTATGTDANSLLVVQGSRSVTGLSQNPARLTGWIALSATSIAPGATVFVTLTLSNTGGATAAGIARPMLAIGGFGTATATAYPAPGTVSIPAGAGVNWVWTVVATGEGFANVLATAAGVDANSGRPVTVAAGALQPLQIGAPSYSPGGLFASPGELDLDRILTLVYTVVNTGGFTLEDLTPTMPALSGDGVVTGVSGPAPAVADLGPGATAAFTWTYRTLRGGLVRFSVGATTAGAPPLGAVVSNPVRIVEAGGSLADAVVYPTPFDPGSAPGGLLKFRRMPPFSTAAVYTNAGELVRECPGDANGFATWDGRNQAGDRVFPGIYFWVLRSPARDIRRGKLEVSR